MIEYLSDILKYSLENECTFVTMEEEIQNASTYIKIMKVRYRDKFDVQWTYEDEINNEQTIKLLLPPLLRTYEIDTQKRWLSEEGRRHSKKQPLSADDISQFFARHIIPSRAAPQEWHGFLIQENTIQPPQKPCAALIRFLACNTEKLFTSITKDLPVTCLHRCIERKWIGHK